MDILYSSLLLTFICNCRFAVGQTNGGSLVALINSDGLQGNIEFFPDNSGSGVTIRVLLHGNSYGEVYKWMIYQFPLTGSTREDCKEKNIGRSIYDFTPIHGHLKSGQDAMFSSKVKLDGSDSIVGRTLVLKGVERGQIVCATIRPTSRIKTYKATFYTPLGGEVFVRQTKFGTYLFSNLYYVNGTRRTTAHEWSLVRTAETDSLQDSHRHEISRCSGLLSSTFLPSFPRDTNYLAVGHSPGVTAGLTFHNLGDVVTLESIPGTIYLLLFSDSKPEQVIACGRLLPMATKIASAKFISSISGEISFTQESPIDPTLVTIDLDNLRQRAYSFGIDDLPIIHRGKKSFSCPNIAKVMYNPLKVQPENIPEPGSGSMDQYAVGDLSGKYGSLQNRKKHFLQVYDTQLTLFGIHSVIGRALVVYYPDGSPLSCANIELNGETVTAFSTFVHPVQGQVILRQAKDNPMSDTSVYVELSHSANDAKSTTYNHGWNIAERAVETGNEYSSTYCETAGPVYDPYYVASGGSYACQCSRENPYRCKLGDLSNKITRLDVPIYKYLANESTIARYFFTTSNVPLSGPTSVIGKSLIIEGSDFVESSITCANIYEYISKRSL
ncbi:uncharacterized protein [Centruroides vittatus]|uniref:uncharacterized protein n=1 Tax=Centruroides vittatus TaxID=120091 RepID=UPI0035106B19